MLSVEQIDRLFEQARRLARLMRSRWILASPEDIAYFALRKVFTLEELELFEALLRDQLRAEGATGEEGLALAALVRNGVLDSLSK